MRYVFEETGLPIKVKRTPEQNWTRHQCLCCGETENITSFTFAIYAGMTQTLDYCRTCSEQIAVFLATTWGSQPDQANLSEEAEMTIADAEKLLAIEKLLSVAVQLAEQLSAKNLLSPEMVHAEGHLRSLLLELVTHGMRAREFFGASAQSLDSWATVLDIIEAGLAGDVAQTRRYAELLLTRLEENNIETIIRHLKKVLSGDKGLQIFPATQQEGTA